MVIVCRFIDEGEMGGEVCEFFRLFVPKMHMLVLSDSTNAVFLGFFFIEILPKKKIHILIF